MNQSDFTALMAGQPTSLELWIQTSDEQIAQGVDVPDGGDFGGVGIRAVEIGERFAYRNYCIWQEITVADGKKAVYVIADAASAARFR